MGIAKFKKFFLGVSAFVAATALFMGNMKSIVEIVSSIFNNHGDEYPILMNFNITDGENGSKRAKIEERGSNLLDVTISYEGNEILIFQYLHVRHYTGYCDSMPTGALVSSAKYKFKFKCNGYHEFKLDPPLVLNPKDASLLNFQIELSLSGRCFSSCGRVFAKLSYQNGKGERGMLPLATAEMVKNKCLEFPVFEDKQNSGIKEIFNVNKIGLIEGKAVN